MTRSAARHTGTRLTLALLIAFFGWATAAEGTAVAQSVGGHHSVVVAAQSGNATVAGSTHRHLGGVTLHLIRSRHLTAPSIRVVGLVDHATTPAHSAPTHSVNARGPPHQL